MQSKEYCEHCEHKHPQGPLFFASMIGKDSLTEVDYKIRLRSLHAVLESQEGLDRVWGEYRIGAVDEGLLVDGYEEERLRMDAFLVCLWDMALYATTYPNPNLSIEYLQQKTQDFLTSECLLEGGKYVTRQQFDRLVIDYVKRLSF